MRIYFLIILENKAGNVNMMLDDLFLVCYNFHDLNRFIFIYIFYKLNITSPGPCPKSSLRHKGSNRCMHIGHRLLTECLILVGPAMFGATFNLLTRVGLPFFGTLKNKSLKNNSLPLTSGKKASTFVKNDFQKLEVLSKSSTFCTFRTIDLLQISSA